jgi:hypothetical protein
MPITPYLNGVRFDPETRRILGVALEIVCIALRTGDCDEYVKQAIATKIIDLAKAGERNPDLLCERVLEEIRGPQGVARQGDTEGVAGAPTSRQQHRGTLGTSNSRMIVGSTTRPLTEAAMPLSMPGARDSLVSARIFGRCRP